MSLRSARDIVGHRQDIEGQPDSDDPSRLCGTVRISRSLVPLLACTFLGVATAFIAATRASQTPASPGQPVVAPASASADSMPVFKVVADWPKPLPNGWILGNVAGLHVDANDHVWVVQRPLSLIEADMFAEDGSALCCRRAPPIIEFDQQGTVLRSFGGADPKNPKGKRAAAGYEWPREHGLFVDFKGNLWTGSDDSPPSATVTKLKPSGELIFQKGKTGTGHGNLDLENFGNPTDIYVDAKTNEAYIADGYHNNRIVVLDADTGAVKRTWGAYGKPPRDIPEAEVCGPYPGNLKPCPRNATDAAPPDTFSYPVHCVVISRDDLVYVCDRTHNRLQVFRKDGTFVSERFIERQTRGSGSVHDIAFSGDPAQTFMYVGDGANKTVWILRRKDLKILGSLGSGGRNAGQFAIVHQVATDSKGNLYVGESLGGSRVQRFNYMGLRRAR